LNSPLPVAIVGAGIGGLAAALALAKAGFEVRLFERASALEPLGAGVQISPNASRLLAALGLGEAAEAAGAEPEALVIRSHRGRVLARMPLGRAARGRYGAPYLVLHRGALQELLLTAVRREPAISLELGTTLAGFDERREALSLRVASPGGESSVEALCLVGADGIRSALRERLVGDGPPHLTRYAAWRAIIPAESAPADLAGPHTGLWLGPGAHLVHYGVDRERLHLVAIVRASATHEGWSAPGSASTLLRQFEGWAQPLRDLLGLVRGWHVWSLADRRGPLPPLAGRATLLGDALHPVLPFLAQGGALAIEDAAVLARELAAQPREPLQALRRYEAARLSRRLRAAAAARRQGAIDHLAGLPALARDTALLLAPPRWLLARQDWLYRWRA